MRHAAGAGIVRFLVGDHGVGVHGHRTMIHAGHCVILGHAYSNRHLGIANRAGRQCGHGTVDQPGNQHCQSGEDAHG